MKYSSNITQKGQVTIPLKVRKFLGLEVGKKIVFNIENNQVVIRPVKNFMDYAGSIKNTKKIDLNNLDHYIKQSFKKNAKRYKTS